MDKKKLTEAEIRTNFITPAIKGAGWDTLTQVREEYVLTKGRIIFRDHVRTRAEGQRVDYVLCYKPNIPIAVIEAKDNKHPVGGGMQQALGYAEKLDVPFAFSSNGDGFLFHNKLLSEGVLERELKLDELPSPEQLWEWMAQGKQLTPHQETLIQQDYFDDGSGKEPRYYQLLAINKTVEAIAKGQNRILLVMATGTGKTYTAFQIIWRLWRSGARKRILFLADRNILVDQTRTNDFKPFGSAMTKIQKRQIVRSYEIYLSLYQAVSGNEEERNVYKQFSRDFFDLIVVDECHRGSAAADSNWREILEYFSSATQIGLTATPKETEDVSNIDYFGDPIYTYSLKQGIEDGFLAPYRVVRFDFDKDISGWTPKAGQVDRYGNAIEEREYNQRDFDRSLVLSKRTELVAQKVTEFLKGTDRLAKTIVFCEDIDHAERMRQALANANADLVTEDRRYVVRITGDAAEGKEFLDDFINPRSRYLVIATTSKLMTTGVDAQTCKVIVLDQRIQSMTEFKQIIGRGTRIHEGQDKYFFTILDFKRATELFFDPEFDGEPVQIYEPGDGPPLPPDPTERGTDEPTRVGKVFVDDVDVGLAAERELHFDGQNRPMTESLKDYTRNTVNREFASMDDFLRRWEQADRKQAIIDALQAENIHFDALAAELGQDANYDPFDLICHLVWGRPPLTRRERAARVKKRDAFSKYGEKARKVLDVLLEKYADQGVGQIERREVLSLPEFRQFGTPVEIARAFGSPAAYEQAIKELEDELYSA